MVADTYTTRLGLIVQGTGNNNNSWGDTFNNSFGAYVDRAIAGVVVRTDTGGTLDLSTTIPPAGPTPAIDYVQKFTGVLVSNLTVQMPNVQKTWLIDNSTTGNFQLFIRNGAAGTLVHIPQGVIRQVICDGAGGMKRADADDVGSFRYSGKAAVGFGELACNGASLLRTDYPDLFNKINTTWGAVDGTHFTLPLLTDTGRFLRSSSGSLTVGTYQANQNLSHTHTASGTTASGGFDHTHSGSGTTSGVSAFHTHSYNQTPLSGFSANSTGGGILGVNAQSGATTGIDNVDHTHNFSFTTGSASVYLHTHGFSFTTGTSGGTEARPESAVALVTILY